MSLLKMFKTDAKLENKGFCLDFGPHETTGNNIKIYLAFAGKTNERYQKAIRRLTKPVERLIQNESLSDEQSEALYKEAFSETCVTGWEEIYLSDLGLLKEGEADSIAECTKSNVMALFTNLPHLYDDCVSKSTKLSNFRIKTQEDEGKN